MDHSLAMRFLQRLANLDGHAQQFRGRHRALLDALGERLALQIFHDEKIRAVLLADVVERADIGVIEAGNRACLALEALANFRRIGQMEGQNLQGHGAVEPRIFRAIDFAHSAGADRCDHFIGTQTRSGSECHLRGIIREPSGAARNKTSRCYEDSESWRAPWRIATA